MPQVSDVGLLALLTSRRLQQHLLLRGAIPGIGFGLKTCPAFFQTVLSVTCPGPLSNHLSTSVSSPVTYIWIKHASCVLIPFSFI